MGKMVRELAKEIIIDCAHANESIRVEEGGGEGVVYNGVVVSTPLSSVIVREVRVKGKVHV